MKNRVLWNKLSAFPLDDASSAFKFSQRLSKENGWDTGYTERVLQEYRRFLYLSSVAGHMVTPSDAVDQAWHLHLCYTRSYWEDLCRDTLGKPLHHGPTKGGKPESAKYHDLYECTLDSYRSQFNEEPPADIWPSAGERFACRDFRRVDSSTHFILPKRRVTQLAVASVAGLALAGCTGHLATTGDGGGLVAFFFFGFIFLILIVCIIKGGKGFGGGGGCGGSGCGGGCGGS